MAKSNFFLDNSTPSQVSKSDGVMLDIYYGSQIPVTTEKSEL